MSPIVIPKRFKTAPVHQQPIHNKVTPIIMFLTECGLLVKIPINPINVKSPPMVKQNIPNPSIKVENMPPI